MLNKVWMQQLLESIEQNSNGREIVLWGKSIEVKDGLEKAGICPPKVYTSNRELLSDNNFPCHKTDDLKGKQNQYYVVIPFFLSDGGKSQRKIMSDFGYKEIYDFVFYPCKDVRITGKTKETDYYDDNNNNVIINNNENVNIYLMGSNNTIIVEQDIEVRGKLEIICKGKGNSLLIEKNCKFYGNNTINLGRDNSVISIGNHCSFSDLSARFWGKSLVKIGECSTFNSRDIFLLHPYSKLIIGKDSMFSFDTVVQTGDGHSIFDLETLKNINSDMEKLKNGYLYDIELGEHVWVSRRAVILDGGKTTKIGMGSIIGASSLVKGQFPNNSTIAGVPAKLIKKILHGQEKIVPSTSVIAMDILILPMMGEG